MRKIFSLLLAAALLCALCGCSGNADKMNELCGVWEMTYVEDEETARGLLESMEFYEEEIVLADLTGLENTMTVEFTRDKTYCYSYDIDRTKAAIREFYDEAVTAVYNGRTGLTDIYGFETINMTEEEFKAFYATELFSMENYEELLDYFVENCLDYTAITDFDKGTFRLSGSRIICTAEGSDTEEEMSYSISGNTLTLVYADGKEVYTRR